MAIEYVGIRFIRPLVVFLVAAVLVGGAIVLIGETLLNVHDAHFTSELKRKELWLGVGLTVGILAIASFLATRPKDSLGPLDDDVAIGSKPMRGEISASVANPYLTQGAPGVVADIAPGYTLNARNGEFAQVVDVLQSVEDVGSRQRTLIFARGLHGVSDELWIPIEAVTAVFPDTQTAYLAVSGDESESLGWNLPPASFSRIERPKETPLY